MANPNRIKAGEYRKYIAIAQPQTTEDKYGGARLDLTSATPVGKFYAKIDTLSGKELYAAQQKVAQVTHKISMRYTDGIGAGMLVWLGSRQFQIQFVENVLELNKKLELLCIERDDSAREQGAGPS